MYDSTPSNVLFAAYRQCGCQDSFAALFARHDGPLKRWISRRFGCLTTEQIEDVAQETWLYVSQADLEHDGSFAGWIRFIARRRALNLKRTLKRKQASQFADDYQPQSRDSGPQEQAIYNEMLTSFRGPERLVYTLVCVVGFTAEQAANALDLHVWKIYAVVKAVKTRFSHHERIF